MSKYKLSNLDFVCFDLYVTYSDDLEEPIFATPFYWAEREQFEGKL